MFRVGVGKVLDWQQVQAYQVNQQWLRTWDPGSLSSWRHALRVNGCLVYESLWFEVSAVQGSVHEVFRVRKAI